MSIVNPQPRSSISYVESFIKNVFKFPKIFHENPHCRCREFSEIFPHTSLAAILPQQKFSLVKSTQLKGSKNFSDKRSLKTQVKMWSNGKLDLFGEFTINIAYSDPLLKCLLSLYLKLIQENKEDWNFQFADLLRLTGLTSHCPSKAHCASGTLRFPSGWNSYV